VSAGVSSDARWAALRGSDLEEGESQGLPVWSRHVGDPILESNITRPVDFALFMDEALENDELSHEAPARVSATSVRAASSQATVWAAAVTSLKVEAEGPFRRDLGDIEEPIQHRYGPR
jgi:hypothetical protein